MRGKRKQAGFSLIEMLIVVALFSIISGAIFDQINQAQKSSTSEQVKLDLFQESRAFMDQVGRDVRAAGYPNLHNFGGDISASSSSNAVGLVKLSYNELWFEGDMDGTGQVSVIRYQLFNDGPSCPCLRRIQSLKFDATPPMNQTQNSTFQMEVQNVENGTSADDPIFTAYMTDGTKVNAVDFMSTAATLAGISAIRIDLTVQSKYVDPVTHQKPTTTLDTMVKLNNCSLAFDGVLGSCR